MKNQIGYLVVALLLSACCSKQQIMQAPVVSMTKRHAPKRLEGGKSISVQWCTGDSPYINKGDNELGMIDQLIMKAQRKHRADFLVNSIFYQKCDCMIVDAEVPKIARNTRKLRGKKRRKKMRKKRGG